MEETPLGIFLLVDPTTFAFLIRKEALPALDSLCRFCDWVKGATIRRGVLKQALTLEKKGRCRCREGGGKSVHSRAAFSVCMAEKGLCQDGCSLACASPASLQMVGIS